MVRAIVSLALLLTATSTALAQTGTMGRVVVVVSGLAQSSGKLHVAIEKSAAAFDDGPLEQSVYRGRTVDASGVSMTVEFEDLPFGVYAVKAFHDVNGNGKLDTNLFGVPSEAFGFSNDASATFGPASFEDARFKLNQSTQVLQIKLQ